MKTFLRLLPLAGIFIFSEIKSQCPAGQEEVTIDVGTDTYGYEIYRKCSGVSRLQF